MQARRLHHNGPERCEAGSPGLLAGRKVTRSVAPLGRRSSPVCESRPNRHCLFQAAHRSGRRGSDRSRHPQSMARPTRKPMAFPHRTDLGKRRAPVRFGPPRTACSKQWHTVSGPAAEPGHPRVHARRTRRFDQMCRQRDSFTGRTSRPGSNEPTGVGRGEGRPSVSQPRLPLQPDKPAGGGLTIFPAGVVLDRSGPPANCPYVRTVALA